MASQEFDLVRRRELHAALSHLTTALWEVRPAAGEGDDQAATSAGGPIDIEKPLSQVLKVAGYPADVSRLVLSVLARYGEPERGADLVRVRDLKGLVEHRVNGHGVSEPVRRLLRAAGHTSNDTKLVLSLLAGADERPEARAVVPALLKVAGYPGDVARLVSVLLDHFAESDDTETQPRARDLRSLVEALLGDAAPPDAVKRVLKAAGYPAEVSRRVLAVLKAADGGSDPRTAVREALRAAGYQAEVSRQVLAVLKAADGASDPRTAVREALRAAGYQAEVAKQVLAMLEAAGEESDPRAAVTRAVKAAGYPAEVSRRVMAALADPGDGGDPRAAVRAAMRAAGYSPEVVRLLDAFGDGSDPKAAVKAALKAAGYQAEVTRQVVAVLEAAGAEADPPAAVKRAVRAAGYPAEVSRQVVAVLEAAGGESDPKAAVRAALRAAGYEAEVSRQVLAVLEAANSESDPKAAVRQALKAAGYQAEVSRQVLAVLNAAGKESDPSTAVREALKAAGYQAEVSRQVLAVLQAAGDDPDPVAAVRTVVKAAGYPPEVIKQLVAVLKTAGKSPDPHVAIKRAIEAAGYPVEVSRQLLAVLKAAGESADPQVTIKRAIEAAGYPVEVSRQVLTVLKAADAEPDPAAAIKRAIKTAGYPTEVTQQLLGVLASVGEGADPQRAVKQALKAAGYPPEVARRALAALSPAAEPAEPADPKEAVRQALRKGAYPKDVVRLVLSLVDASNDSSGVRTELPRVLDKAGYPSDVRRLVQTLLERYGDADHRPDGLQPRELTGLVAGGDDRAGVVEPVSRLLRAAGYPSEAVGLVGALLERFSDPESAGQGLSARDLQPLLARADDGMEVREPVRRILRVAGYRTDLVKLVDALLDRYGAAEAPASGARIRDLADLVADADDDLLALMRHWRTPATDGRHLGHELVTLLGHHGVDIEAARDLAAVVTRDPGEGQLKELARVARFALSAEDACISMAEPAWQEDPAFVAAYAEAKRISAWGRDIRWRVQTLVKLAAGARHLPGDFVECGVDTGGTARAVMAYLGDDAFEGRTFYLFDTFRGLVPEQLLADEPAPIEDRYPDVAAVARANFADKPYVRIVEGMVPQTLPEYTGSQVAFLHIDMNAAAPEVAAFTHFWGLLSPGAPIVFDDYGFPRHRVQRRALDEAASALDVEIMMLPTCQGIVFKPPLGV